MTTCTRCNEADAAGFCCEAHGKQLCHRCYRRTHFVEICMPGCPGCEREGLNPNATVGDRVPKPKPAPLSEKWANMPSAESTSAQLARVTEERDLLAARIQRAHEALAIEEFDGDSCDTLESTVQYAVHHYRLVCDSEATAADEIGRLRGELAAAEVERDELAGRLKQMSELRAEAIAAVVRIRNERDEANELCDKIAAELRLVTRERDSLARRCAVRFAERDAARAELANAARNGWIVARDGGRDCLDCGLEIRRGEAYELTSATEALKHVHCRDED